MNGSVNGGDDLPNEYELEDVDPYDDRFLPRKRGVLRPATQPMPVGGGCPKCLSKNTYACLTKNRQFCWDCGSYFGSSH